MPVAEHNLTALDDLLPLTLLLISFFSLLCYAGVLLLLSLDQRGQGLDSLGSSCAYTESTIQAYTVSSKNKE